MTRGSVPRVSETPANVPAHPYRWRCWRCHSWQPDTAGYCRECKGFTRDQAHQPMLPLPTTPGDDDGA